MELQRDRVNERPLVDHGTNHDVAVDSIGRWRARISGSAEGSSSASCIRLRSPISEMVMGDQTGVPWSMTIRPTDREKAVSGVIRRPFTATASAPCANSRLTMSCASWKLTR